MQALRDVIRQDICRKRSVVSDVLCHLKCLRLGITYALLIRHSLCFKGAANAPLKLFLLDIFTATATPFAHLSYNCEFPKQTGVDLYTKNTRRVIGRHQSVHVA